MELPGTFPRPEPAQPRRFYDGGTDTEPPDPAADPRIMLERDVVNGGEVFRMLRRIAYRDEEYGELLVPADLAGFRTGLASVPALFTWLVPRTGNHLPPALLHDALIPDRGEAAAPDYISTDGHVIDREAADRVFRAAMRDAHTAIVRRWLVWSAVTLTTIWRGSDGWSRAEHARRRIVLVATLVLVAALGVVATLDLFDVVSWVPWMGTRPLALEVAGGLAGAIVIPLILGLAWGRLRIAGAVTGISLAVLLHVTVVLAALTLLYQLVEHLAVRRPVALLAAALTVLAAAFVLTVLLVGTA